MPPVAVEPRRDQTALRGPAHFHSRKTDCDGDSVAPQKPLRATRAAKQSGELDPWRGTLLRLAEPFLQTGNQAFARLPYELVVR